MSRRRDRAREDSHRSILRAAPGFAARKPRIAIGIWLVLVAALALYGRGIEHKLSVEPALIDDTASKRASEVAIREFGWVDAFVVMLRGPRADVEAQGLALERRLGERPRVAVTSPWTGGEGIQALRPSPDVVALLVSIRRLPGEDFLDPLSVVERDIDATVTSGVDVSVAGGPAIADSFRQAIEDAVAVGERIALPALLLVLLLVFRSVLAAAIPVLVGGAVVAAGYGALNLLLNFLALDIFTLAVMGMMGLALGVDYSLLTVSRFREELATAGDVTEAAQRTVGATSRSVLPAGCGLVLAMLVASQVLPGALITSVAAAVITAAILSVISAMIAVPAVLALLGENLDRWSLPRRKGSRSMASLWSGRMSRRPRLAIWMVAVFLLVFAAQAFTIDTGTATVSQLPRGDEGRRHQEAVQRELGAGWVAPLEVVMDGGDRPVTTPNRLRQLAAFQRRVERDPGVELMVGFSPIERRTRQLGDLEQSLASQQTGLARINRGILRVREGSVRNTDGMFLAAEGARRLGSGITATHAGAGLLTQGIGNASQGTEALAGGLERADRGSGELAENTTKASEGAGRLTTGLERAQDRTGEILGSARSIESAMRLGERRVGGLEPPLKRTEDGLGAASAALQKMTVGRDDPQYAAVMKGLNEATAWLTGTDPATGEPVEESFDGIDTGLESVRGQFSVGLYLAEQLHRNGDRAQDGIEKLARGSARLDRGLMRLADGSDRMSHGIARLSSGSNELAPGLSRLHSGAEHLAGGLGELEVGAGGLAGGLGGGAQKSKLLTGGLQKINSGIERRQADSDGADPTSQSPGLFESGYFYLASLDGSSPRSRRSAGFLVSLDQGGTAARMIVIPRFDPSDQRALKMRDRIQAEASDLARDTGTDVALGGLMATQLDIDSSFRDQVPLAILALSLVTIFVQLFVTRSLVLPFVAAALNILTAAATIGLLAVFFNDSLLGGPGYVETTVLPATIMLLFGLALDYEVFVFARIREEYERTGSAEGAIANGLRHSAHVVTGAALIMLAVFLAFAASQFATIRNFGVAQATGVFIDAFIIRLVAIPSAMRALGAWGWWMPRWLDRVLPGRSVRSFPEEKTA